jgi:hypothetical protein
MLSLDSIYGMKVPTADYKLEFFSVSEIFPVVGKYFHFWPLVSSRHYKVGGLKDFEFSVIDRFGMSLTFQYDYFSQRLRVSSRLNIIKYDDAYGADVNSDLLIASISDRLCDEQFFADEDTGELFLVVSVERNKDPDLVDAKKQNMRFNGLVVWTLPSTERSATKAPDLLLQCRTDPVLRALHCVPMDPDDFDSDRHVILTQVISTPAKRKREKKDPDAFTPEATWKPSASSSRGRKSDEIDSLLRVYLNHCLSSVEHEYEHNASRWLMSAIFNGLHPSSSVDIRLCIETCLEFSSISDINEAFINVLDIDMEDRIAGRPKRDVYLKLCVNECVSVAKDFKKNQI